MEVVASIIIFIIIRMSVNLRLSIVVGVIQTRQHFSRAASQTNGVSSESERGPTLSLDTLHAGSPCLHH